MSLYQYSQLSCIVATSVLAIALMFIGNNKAREQQWIFRAKWAVIIVFLLVCGLTLVQFTCSLDEIYPKINTAINVTSLFAMAYILALAFFPVVHNTTIVWSKMRITLIVFLISTTLAWTAVACEAPLDGLMLTCSIALFLCELSRITITFVAKYRSHSYNTNKSRNSGKCDSQRPSTCILARAIAALSLFALMYTLLGLWNQSLMAFFNFVALILWVYIFVAIINVMINYAPNYDLDIPSPATKSNKETTLNQPDDSQPSHPSTSTQEGQKSDLNQLVINMLESKIDSLVKEKFFCSHTITMDSIAQQLNTNRSYLSRYINLTYGCTFNTWLTQLRVDEAAQLLIDHPTLPLDKIALMVGFSSRSHFMSSFKAAKDVTPGQWREHHARAATTASDAEGNNNQDAQ